MPSSKRSSFQLTTRVRPIQPQWAQWGRRYAVPAGMLQDPSSPPVVTQVAAPVTISTAAFSPPAGALLLAFMSSGWSTTPRTVAFADTTGTPWTDVLDGPGITANNGRVAIKQRRLAAAPGSITATATWSGAPGGTLLAVFVLTATAVDQSPAHAGGVVQRYTASTSATATVIPTTTAGLICGISNNPDTAAAFTPNTDTTVLADFTNVTDVIRTVLWCSTQLTDSAGIPDTLGGSWASPVNSVTAAVEVIPVMILAPAAPGGTRQSAFMPFFT